MDKAWAWEVREGADADKGRNALTLPFRDAEECRRVCAERGFGGFVVWRSKAYFREAAGDELLQRAQRASGAVLHARVRSAPAAAPASPKPAPKAAAAPAAPSPAPPPASSPQRGAMPPPSRTESGAAPARGGYGGAPAEAARTSPGGGGAAAAPAEHSDGPGADFVMLCHKCARPIQGEHLILEMPDGEEVPVHEGCHAAELPVCVWCRVPISDSYTVFRTAQGVVHLHELCLAPFAERTAQLGGAPASLSRPSEQRAAGRDGDRLFIAEFSVAQLREELARRGRSAAGCVEKSELVALVRRHWDDPVIC
eukprot:TRINITY_DN14783_c0_g2_i1.p1 TRINITY_DN14783_c0_g2~~TRINITY_DN14783_c0_g2_i1.p1  ORF type:complete len:334 (+),score=74.15 TRINITY_DN14783_c0_g2_i1:71-1003(+)